ncbi:MAG: DsbA family protein [Pseudomonadota bacterium]
MKVLVVTDPLCSWCWGMSPAVEAVGARLAGEVELDIVLGGVNTSSTLPVGQYGRQLLRHIWREVEATTGQRFCYAVPEGFVYNSTVPCLAVAAARRALGRPPFGYLHRLQQLFFEQGRNTNDRDLLCRAADELGIPAGAVAEGLDDPEVAAALRADVADARAHGTSGLPNVVVERDGARSLLLGGYADAETLESMIRTRLAAADQL